MTLEDMRTTLIIGVAAFRASHAAGADAISWPLFHGCGIGAGLLCHGNRTTVAEMNSTERIKPRDLVVGGRYLNRNGLFIRQIEAIEGKTVHYHDQYSSWSCFNSSFVKACPTVATPEDEARVAEELRKLVRRG